MSGAQAAAGREAPRETGQRLATFQRRGGFGKPDAELRVVLDTFEGKRFVSLRLWERGADTQFYPTPKGITIRVGELYEVIRALCGAARELGVELHPKGDGASRG